MVNFKLKEVRELFKRRYKLMNIGLELAFAKASSKNGMYVTFQTVVERDMFYDAMLEVVSKNEGGCVTAEQTIMEYTQMWVQGNISNYEYLMYCNSYAQRSFQDLT